MLSVRSVAKKQDKPLVENLTTRLLLPVELREWIDHSLDSLWRTGCNIGHTTLFMYFLIKQIIRKKVFCDSFTNLKYYVINNIGIDLTSTRNPSYMIYYLSNGSTTIILALEIAREFSLKINIGLRKLWIQ